MPHRRRLTAAVENCEGGAGGFALTTENTNILRRLHFTSPRFTQDILSLPSPEAPGLRAPQKIGTAHGRSPAYRIFAIG